MKNYVIPTLSVIALTALALPVNAQNIGDTGSIEFWKDPNDGADHMPYCETIGPTVGPVIVGVWINGLDDLTPRAIYNYGAYGKARGMHLTLHPARHNKIASVSLYSYKGISCPPISYNGNQFDMIDTNQTTGVTYSVHTITHSAWLFRWRHSFCDIYLNAQNGEMSDSLSIESTWTWETYYIGSGRYWWLGGAYDDWGTDTGENAKMSLGKPLGPYTSLNQ
jgi:hypothetical protein